MTPLVDIVIGSIYEVHGVKVPLPARMAKCPPDVKTALIGLSMALKAKGGALILSDLFRSYDMQLGSHMDYVSGKKKAFSPPPGGSLHEGGRSIDLDLKALKITLPNFWPIAAEHGFVPIIDQPNPRTSESWHFECRGSHSIVYDHYKARKGTNFAKPYQAMAASAIVSVGVKVDKFGEGQREGYLQSALIRLGHDIGNMDGQIGPRTRDALKAAGIGGLPVAEAITAIDLLLQKSFPQEFFDRAPASPAIR